MKVLVTGGAGFIGSHIVDKLIDRGDRVVIVDNLSTGTKAHLHPEATFYHMDIREERLFEVFDLERPEVVIHQAAQNNVPTSLSDPIYDAEVNIIGTIRLLEACHRAQVKKVIYASSAALYGDPCYLPIDEKHPVSPQSAYGISKYVPEHYLKMYANLYGLKYTILRYANTYGPRQGLHGEGAAIPSFISRMIQKKPLLVTGDGEQTRDYIYVEDIAYANLAAIDNGDGEILNIGTGISTSLNHLIKILEEISGEKLEVNYVPKRPGDIKDSYFDNHLAKKKLNWFPQTDLPTGLKRTFEAWKKGKV
mgnify:FL=1